MFHADPALISKRPGSLARAPRIFAFKISLSVSPLLLFIFYFPVHLFLSPSHTSSLLDSMSKKSVHFSGDITVNSTFSDEEYGMLYFLFSTTLVRSLSQSIFPRSD